MFIRKLPSPSMSTTRRSGIGACTPIAAGRPKPIVPRPLLVSQRARLVELVELGGPHLVLADADGDHRVAVVRQLPQLVDRVLRQDAGELLVVVERLVALPRLALLDPGGNVVRALRRSCSARRARTSRRCTRECGPPCSC